MKTFRIELDRTFTLLLLVCFIASLLLCNDAVCINESTKVDCAAFVCSSHNGNDSSPDNSLKSNSHDCSCTCHIPALAVRLIDLSSKLDTFTTLSRADDFFPSAPSRLIYRPPIAA